MTCCFLAPHAVAYGQLIHASSFRDYVVRDHAGCRIIRGHLNMQSCRRGMAKGTHACGKSTLHASCDMRHQALKPRFSSFDNLNQHCNSVTTQVVCLATHTVRYKTRGAGFLAAVKLPSQPSEQLTICIHCLPSRPQRILLAYGTKHRRQGTGSVEC